MAIKIYKPYTPSTRNKSSLDFSILSKKKPEKSLTVSNQRAKGRNNQGRITTRHKGGGHKKLYRLIDFKRNNSYRLSSCCFKRITVPRWLCSTKRYSNSNLYIFII